VLIMLRVYGDAQSGNCYKLKLVLHQLGLAYEWVAVDILKQESRTADFLRMNPKGQVPVLELAPGRWLAESNAILHYLADGSALLPSERLQHAHVLQWMFFEQYNHEPTVASARFIVRYLGRPPEHELRLQQKITAGYEALALMEQHLQANAWFAADRYTIADIALYAYTHVADEGGFDLAGFRAINDWMERVKAQPAYVGMND
jgi:glutathione S-transferase